ncbi:zinc finger protein 638-like isoform X2 [Trachinotus anak]|uniref:zinc finger protein 638-like isoform X2 n=1 Tax=Trachinotus anak TaxID=443729 RepID=UPI0039F1C68B
MKDCSSVIVYFCFPPHSLAVHTDSNSHRAPILCLEPSATFSVSNSTRGTHFIFGPVAGAAAVTALHLAQIEIQAQIALRQLASLATITVGNQYHNNNRFAAALPPHLALLSLISRQEVSAVGINVGTNCKTYRTTRPCLPATMYHHHSQQQGPQPFSNGPRPPHQPHPNQHQNRTPSDMLSQVMGFQFPRPTQLPDELESALAIRGVRDMDHRLIDHMNPPNQHQNQGSGSGISQHGTYSSNQITLTSDSQPGHQQGIDWSSYQPPTKLFASPPPSASHQSQRHQGPQQQPESSHTGTSIPSWTASVSDSPSPQARHPHGGGSGGGGGGGGDSQSLYTPESAGSILASFGLSNEDLEVLSHYPDDQLTPDTLPFILRDIQINKSGNQKTSASSSSFSHNIHDMPMPPSRSSPLARSRSPEVPSLLTVTQTAGKVIDYGHASRAKDENSTRETFKREPLSSERTVKMYPSSSSSASKVEKAERRQVHLEHTEPSKHGDRDYRRTSSDHRKSSRSPGRELPPSSKSRNLDRDYRHEGPKPRPSSETRSDDSSRRSVSSSSGSKTHRTSKKLPTPTMIGDFSAVSPKVYPHTCSLCQTQCDQEKDWVDHVNTVNHTAACRDLRNKYPHWKPNLSSRSGRYGTRALWDSKDDSPSHSVSRSLSGSPTPGPPHSKHGVGPHPHRPQGKLYSPRPRYHPYTEHGRRLEHHHSGSRSPAHSHRTSASSREHQAERRNRESSGGSSRSAVKRPHNDSTKFSSDISRHPSSKAGHTSKHGLSQSNTKTVRSGTKTGAKTPKNTSAKATDTFAKPPPAKKKKKMATPASQDSSVPDRLVYLTGIPNDASEQEVTDLVGSFGKINNVILMPCSEEESKKGEGQKASVCMVKAEDAQALANSSSLSIRDQQITASIAKKPEEGQSAEANSRPASGKEKAAAGENSGGEADQKTSDEKGTVLITGLPESSWSESDIIKLIQPFGTPSDIILATQIGKVLVSVPDMEIAQEIVKVHTFIPAKIKDSELKIIQVKQRIGLSTPVALYNLLMGSVDPLESPVPVGWSTLLVISNVPNTPSGPSEVQKLVRRFGTVIKTLVLNNTVICEMATAAMALSVYKRFQTFPCIIQNNPLFFSRKPDPKASTQTKVITAYLDSPEDTTANGKGSQTATAAAAGEETADKERPESAVEGKEDDADDKTKSMEKMVGEDEALGENGSKDEIKKDKLTPDPKPEVVLDTDMRETSAVQTVMETEENKEVNASEAGNDRTPTSGETKQSSPDGKEASREMPALPKVTQEMVNALLVECRTRTTSHPNNNNTETSSCGLKEKIPIETEQGEKAAKETKELAKNHAEDEMKKQDTERREREARKEKEVKERERKERERRAWEKEERAKREREWEERARREREKREEERREWERRERERKERKRAYGGGLSGSRLSCRSEGYKQSSWRDVQSNSSEAETKMVEEEEEEFPFNMNDFVTVDEVGDVNDLPSSPSPDVPMKTTEVGEDAPTSVPQDPPRDTPTEIATVIPVKPDEEVSECEVVSAAAAQSLVVSAAAVSQADSSLSQTHELTCRPEAPETETTSTATQDSTPEDERLFPHAPPAAHSPPEAAPADLPSNRPAGEVTTEREEDKTRDSALNHNQAKEEVVVLLDKTEEQGKTRDQEVKETGTPAADTGKRERSEDQRNTQDESAKKLQKKTPMSTDYVLPPFDPSNPVGMEFLVPKTGFFCKVCNRFFSGAKEAEINHCKTVKHYENLQKYLKTTKPVNETTKPDPS